MLSMADTSRTFNSSVVPPSNGGISLDLGPHTKTEPMEKFLLRAEVIAWPTVTRFHHRTGIRALYLQTAFIGQAVTAVYNSE